MITEMQEREDGKRAKRNRLGHVLIRDAGDYSPRHSKEEKAPKHTFYANRPNMVWMGCVMCVSSMKEQP